MIANTMYKKIGDPTPKIVVTIKIPLITLVLTSNLYDNHAQTPKTFLLGNVNSFILINCLIHVFQLCFFKKSSVKELKFFTFSCFYSDLIKQWSLKFQ